MLALLLVVSTARALAAGAACYDRGWNEQSAIDLAEELFRAEQWEKAAVAYEAFAQSDATNGQAWLRAGSARFRLAQWQRASASFAPSDRAIAQRRQDVPDRFRRDLRGDEVIDMPARAETLSARAILGYDGDAS